MDQWRISSENRTVDELIVLSEKFISASKIQPSDITASIIASVVPSSLKSLILLCKNYFNCAPQIVGNTNINLGIEVKLKNPDEVGADRLVNAVAAHQSYKGPMIIIDFGTATTFDLIDINGNYLGGVIAPGVNLSLETLHKSAAQLPRIEIEHTKSVIGKNTIEAMQSGIYWGYIGLIEGLISRLSLEYGKKINVIATGGLASMFIEGTKFINHFDQLKREWGLRARGDVLKRLLEEILPEVHNNDIVNLQKSNAKNTSIVKELQSQKEYFLSEHYISSIVGEYMIAVAPESEIIKLENE